MTTHEKAKRELLVALARRFDPRIIMPDNLAAAAFWALCREWGTLEVELQTVRRLADWLPEDWTGANGMNAKCVSSEEPSNSRTDS